MKKITFSHWDPFSLLLKEFDNPWKIFSDLTNCDQFDPFNNFELLVY